MVRRSSDRLRPTREPYAEDKSNKTEISVRKKKQRRNKTKVLHEIKRLRKTTNLLIPKLPFCRLVREILYTIFPRTEINRIQVRAMEALQEAVELYLTQFFEDAYLLTYHTKKKTLSLIDVFLLRRLRGRNDVINR